MLSALTQREDRSKVTAGAGPVATAAGLLCCATRQRGNITCEIWEKLLKVSPIGSMTTSLASEATRFWRCAWLLSAATLPARSRSLLLFRKRHNQRIGKKMLREQIASPESPLVAIQPQGERTPSSSCTSVAANVLCYLDLARYVGFGPAFRVIQIRVCWAPCLISESIVCMAKHYVECIRAAQASGLTWLVAGRLWLRGLRDGEIAPPQAKKCRYSQFSIVARRK